MTRAAYPASSVQAANARSQREPEPFLSRRLSEGALEALFESLRKPMLRMVQHQATLTAGREVHRTDRPGYIRGLTEAATAAAATAMSTGTAWTEFNR